MCICVSILGCTDNETESKWYQEEVLVQLQELKKEVRSLREDVAELSKGRSRSAGNRVTNIRLDDAPSLNEKAQIAIVEFSDLQCPFCARHDRQVFPELKKKYLDTGKLRYVARDFPLSFHAQARPAALATHCAGDQDKYWEMRHFLFANRNLGRDLFVQGADKLGLDRDSFVECLDTKKNADRVEADFTYGQQIGVSGTPRFYIGRVEGDKLVDVVPLAGAQPFSAFERVIDKFLNNNS
nr:thioredoxin domain-containing protein [Microbulbifer rhizosphaerae]